MFSPVCPETPTSYTIRHPFLWPQFILSIPTVDVCETSKPVGVWQTHRRLPQVSPRTVHLPPSAYDSNEQTTNVRSVEIGKSSVSRSSATGRKEKDAISVKRKEKSAGRTCVSMKAPCCLPRHPNRAGRIPRPRAGPGSTGLLPSPQTLQAQSHSSPLLGPKTAFLPAPGFQPPQPGLYDFRPEWSTHSHYAPSQVSPLSSTAEHSFAGSFHAFPPERSQTASQRYGTRYGEYAPEPSLVTRVHKG